MKLGGLVQLLKQLKASRGVANSIRIDKILVILFWLHLPAGLLVNLAYQREAWLDVLWQGALVVLTPTVALILLPKGSVWMRVLNGLMAMVISSWLIYLSGGTIEFHFHVFVCLAVLSYYRDYRVLVPAATFICFHHLILNFVNPYACFTYGANFSMVLIHALFVWLETAYLIFDINEIEHREEMIRQATKTEAIGQLTGGVAHDFNNLLTVISGNTELLGESEALSPEARQSVGMITHAVNRATELTRHLLAFGRQAQLTPRQLNLNDSVASVEKMLRRTLGEHVTVRTCLAPDLWKTFADRAQVESALLNLAVNARDAMPNGGELTIETSNLVLSATGDRMGGLKAGDYVLLTVRDTGSGMKPEVIARAFDPFFTTKEIGKGTGLGLSMVYGFVKQSGGHASIQSKVDKGTAINLYLPRLTVQTSPEKTKSSETEGPLTGSETVLVVEDDPFVRAHAAGLLAGLGYTVLQAKHAPSALAVARSATQVDLLFTDVIMPGGMNGRQLANELLRQRPTLRVLYTSGYPASVLSHDGRLEPGIALLRKPYLKRDLASVVRKVLDAGTRETSPDAMMATVGTVAAD